MFRREWHERLDGSGGVELMGLSDGEAAGLRAASGGTQAPVQPLRPGDGGALERLENPP